MLGGGCEDSMKKTRLGSELSRFGDHPIRAIAMLSGGLDSTLAAALVKRAGVEVIGLTVRHLFAGGSRREAVIARAADMIGIPLRVVDRTVDHLDVVRHPQHGYGSAINPCIDCRIFMLKTAAEVMNEEGARFVVTGEVLGQRPMSQHYRALLLAAEESGLGDRLVRPLSANLLPETLPVREGWLRSEDLLAIHGRSRQAQMELAAQLGIEDYPSPAGGCLLTEKAYAARLRDAFSHAGKDAVQVDDFRRLRHGRHFRLSATLKVIVGRNERENAALTALAPGLSRIEPRDVMGPTALLEGDPTPDELQLASRLVARYCDHNDERPIALRVVDSDGNEKLLSESPLSSDDPRLDAWRI
jgi:tRNA-uridine 2-sulfurtransferase